MIATTTLLLCIAADASQAHAAFRAFDYAQAAQLFADAAGAAPDDATRADLYRWQGIARAQLADFDGARAAFRAALAADPALDPSTMMAPGVRALFIEEKALVATPPAPAPPAPTPSEPTPIATPTTAPAAPEALPTTTDDPPPAAGTALPWIGAATGAAGVVVAGAGVAVLVFSQVRGCNVACGTAERPQATQREAEEARTAYWTALALGAAGGAITAVGAGVFVLTE